ncbi:transposase [Peribacillus butanolivorans]|uniref:REP-associated tyrosine transposase n=1 Tax=Peribacillus butanolivorans TaxID=421767 RepID=UPI0035D6373B
MPRKPRIWYPGAMYHITSRGNRHSNIFLDDKDRLRYLHHLEETKEKYFFELHSYCLMTNHVHLLLETMQHPISDIMHKLNSRYAISFNRRHDHDGHLFQGRYHSVLIESIEQFTATSRYIHLNPVKANIVKNPAEYKWSSYKAFQIGKPNMHVNPTQILHYFQTPQNYEEYVMRGSDHISHL